MKIKSIQDIIPQKEPFIFIDEIISVTENQFVSKFTPHNNHVLVFDGLLSEAGMMENMAQTAAAGMGVFFQNENQAIPRGFIGAVKNFHIQALAPVNQAITTTVTILQEVFGVTLVSAEIRLQAQLLASAEMKIVLENHA